MKILVACEESQEVCKAFRAKGHEAYSCDILPCSGDHPEWHIQSDIKKVIAGNEVIAMQNGDKKYIRWDYRIGFPPCTDLAVSGAKHFTKKRESGKQLESINFFLFIAYWCDCVENPVGIMSGKYLQKYFPEFYNEWKQVTGFPRKPDQIIQPYHFGDPFTKTTCLWLNNFPKLTATNIVNRGKRHVTKGGKSLPDWYNLPPSENRAKLRSKTFPGIAKAMADQWGDMY